MGWIRKNRGKAAMGIIAVLFFGLLGAWTAVGFASTAGIETPEYTVLGKPKGYEVREYAGFIRAEVTVPGPYDEAISRGFRGVAEYIFGGNTQRADIAMTAPVLTEKASQKIAMTAPVLAERADGAEERYVVAFVMPKAWTLATLPVPNNPALTLREVPKTRYAVLKFRGYATAKRCAAKTDTLRKALARDGVETAGEPIIAQFDPPWTPPYMRKNEIQIALN